MIYNQQSNEKTRVKFEVQRSQLTFCRRLLDSDVKISNMILDWVSFPQFLQLDTSSSLTAGCNHKRKSLTLYTRRKMKLWGCLLKRQVSGFQLVPTELQQANNYFCGGSCCRPDFHLETDLFKDVLSCLMRGLQIYTNLFDLEEEIPRELCVDQRLSELSEFVRHPSVSWECCEWWTVRIFAIRQFTLPAEMAVLMDPVTEECLTEHNYYYAF